MHVGQTVLARDYRGAQKWTQAEVVSGEGMPYTVKVAQDMLWRRHIDQLLSSTAQISTSPCSEETTAEVVDETDPEVTRTGQLEKSIVPADINIEHVPVPQGTSEARDTRDHRGVRQ